MRGIIFTGIAAVLLGGSLGGCAERIAENRIKSALTDAGLDEANSVCMAEWMTDRLSIAQLRKLEALKPRKGESVRPATISQFVGRLRRIEDQEVISVAVTSAAVCLSALEAGGE